jgi:hypothetical protein
MPLLREQLYPYGCYNREIGAVNDVSIFEGTVEMLIETKIEGLNVLLGHLQYFQNIASTL